MLRARAHASTLVGRERASMREIPQPSGREVDHEPPEEEQGREPDAGDRGDPIEPITPSLRTRASPDSVIAAARPCLPTIRDHHVVVGEDWKC